MKVALLLTYRELRSSWRRLAFFTLCLSLGVGSIVVLRSTIESVNAFIAGESRAINSGDITIRASTRDLTVVGPVVERYEAEGRISGRSEYVELPTMLGDDAGSTSKLVQLKAVEAGYPLYGKLTLAGGAEFSPEMLAGRGVLIGSILAGQLGLTVGDVVKLGDARFTIRGLVDREPDSGIPTFSAGARAIIGKADLGDTKLLEKPVRARSVTMLLVPESEYAGTVADLKKEFDSSRITVRGYTETEQSISSTLKTAGDFLSLVGLAILALGGVGIWSVTRVYIAERWKTIAVLKCLGCRNRVAVFAYTLQMVFVGLAGAVVGVAIAGATIAAVRSLLSDGPLATIGLGLTWSAVGQGAAAGVLVALLFSMTPLLGVRDIRPNLVLRAADPRRASRWTISRFLSAVVVIAGLLTVASWQGGSLRIGGFFLGGLLVAGAASALSGSLLVWAIRSFGRIPVFSLRHAALGVNRPGNQTRAILVAIGLGVFFLVGVNGVERTIRRGLERRQSDDLPDMYLLDVQKDQIAGVRELLRSRTGSEPILVGTVRARIAEIDGVPFDPDSLADPRDRSRLGREFTVATRPELDETVEAVSSGKWWPSEPSEEPEVSVESELAQDFKLDVGRSITFDVQGKKISARISSIRTVDWQNARLGFIFVVRPGGLDSVHVVANGAVKGPEDAVERGRLARALSDRFSNVSVIDAREVIANLTGFLSKVTLAISVVGSIVLAAGLLILAGSVAMARYVREYEIAVMKTLGARTRTLLAVLVIEHAILGGIAGAVGASLGVALAWSLCTWILRLSWALEAAPAVLAVGLAILLTTAVGLASSADLLLLRPLSVLRRVD
ncbi:MAG: FtsX-like permease family protein [Acidobacteria bacterium]|nr:FtsX-like permease family protein [Acidobacteriota bacterium]